MTEAVTSKPYKKLFALDFDGVLHAYTTPWTDAGTISDGPNAGAMEFLWTISGDTRFEVVVCSSRCREDAGIKAIEQWLIRQMGDAFGDEGRRIAADIPVLAEKPPAFITLDDRAVTFMGQWPSLDRLASFLPWNKRPMHLRPDPEFAVAANDALMMLIAKLAAVTGCPDGTVPLDWIERMAKVGAQFHADLREQLEAEEHCDFDEGAAKGFDPENTLIIDEDIDTADDEISASMGNAKNYLYAGTDVSIGPERPEGWTGDIGLFRTEDGRVVPFSVPVMSADDPAAIPERAARYLAETERRRTAGETIPAVMVLDGRESVSAEVAVQDALRAGRAL